MYGGLPIIKSYFLSKSCNKKSQLTQLTPLIGLNIFLSISHASMFRLCFFNSLIKLPVPKLGSNTSPCNNVNFFNSFMVNSHSLRPVLNCPYSACFDFPINYLNIFLKLYQRFFLPGRICF